MKRISKCTALLFLAFLTTTPAESAKKAPFSGNWISLQYTNGKEFRLKLEQADGELIGWEGKLPPNMEKVAPDLKGVIKGKIADIEVQHRRGYQAHAQLRLQGTKLVWQLMESDNRSSRYFPLASTLNRSDDDNPPEQAQQLSAVNNSSDQPIWGILEAAESFDSGETAQHQQNQDTSPYFSAYRALLGHNIKADDISLQALLKSNKAAGRLYAAVILWDLNHADGLEAFKSLAKDDAPVVFKSTDGKTTSTTVTEIARSFMESGAYMDFPSKKY